MYAWWIKRWQSLGESVISALTYTFNGLSGDMGAVAERIAIQSGLPGMADGPADALKHITLAAMLALETGSGVASNVMGARETISDFFHIGTNSRMDRENNALGLRIGAYLRERGHASRLEAAELAGAFVRAAVKEGEPCHLWQRGKDGLSHHDGVIEVVKGRLFLPYPTLVITPACMPE